MEPSEKIFNLDTGRVGEDIAAKFLSEKGYEIVARNYVSGKVEIDLICRIDKLFVFVEVKTRSQAIVQPEMAVNYAKQKHIASAASSFLYRNNISDPIRFDIISINYYGGKMDITHFEDAFYPVYFK